MKTKRAGVTALDLFCGAAGGWSLGLHRAGVRTIAACEIDDWRRGTFAANNPAVRMYADVKELNATRLLADLGYLPDWIIGSPPCQDASCANTAGKGVDGERTGLFFEAIRLVDECRPRWAVLENVPGLRTRGADRVLADLEALGYVCWPLVVGAWHAGAPHRRNRVWIVAADLDAAREPLGIAGQSRPAGLGDAADARGVGRRGGPDIAFPEPESGIAADAVSGELRQQSGRGGGTDRSDTPVIAIANSWPSWGEPVARHLGVADGLSARLASIRVHTGKLTKRGKPETNRGDRACIAAYGDAVLPQITEAIARSILAVEAGMAR